MFKLVSRAWRFIVVRCGLHRKVDDQMRLAPKFLAAHVLPVRQLDAAALQQSFQRFGGEPQLLPQQLIQPQGKGHGALYHHLHRPALGRVLSGNGNLGGLHLAAVAHQQGGIHAILQRQGRRVLHIALQHYPRQAARTCALVYRQVPAGAAGITSVY